jgi:NAD+ synthetase
VFDGGSFNVDQDEFCLIGEEFQSMGVCFDLEKQPQTKLFLNPIETLHEALVCGIKDYVHKTGFSKVVLGLSGGIDSAVTCALAVSALGPENVKGLLMPSEFSSKGSLDDANALARLLKIQTYELPIKEVNQTVLSSFSSLFSGSEPDLAEENIQSRIRGLFLMAYSNKFGSLLLNTGNKSELAVGYCTLYGDMNGALSVLSDVYKTQVYELAYFMNRKTKCIPVASIEKPPSAELREDQTDQDSLPEYDVLDGILKLRIEKGYAVEKIVSMGYEKSLVEWVCKQVFLQEYKRSQSAMGLKVSGKAFGLGRRFPLVSKS